MITITRRLKAFLEHPYIGFGAIIVGSFTAGFTSVKVINETAGNVSITKMQLDTYVNLNNELITTANTLKEVRKQLSNEESEHKQTRRSLEELRNVKSDLDVANNKLNDTQRQLQSRIADEEKTKQHVARIASETGRLYRAPGDPCVWAIQGGRRVYCKDQKEIERYAPGHSTNNLVEDSLIYQVPPK